MQGSDDLTLSNGRMHTFSTRTWNFHWIVLFVIDGRTEQERTEWLTALEQAITETLQKRLSYNLSKFATTPQVIKVAVSFFNIVFCVDLFQISIYLELIRKFKGKQNVQVMIFR